MKKSSLLILSAIALMATSCATISKTASTDRPREIIRTAVTADLDVSDKKITFKYEPSKSVRRGGNQNVINTAIAEALRNNGDGDVLVQMEYTTQCKGSSLGISPIRMIVVSGYPAKYKNFRNLNDSIWDKAPFVQPGAVCPYIHSSKCKK